VQNKGMRRLSLRRPSWARQSVIRCRLDGRDIEPTWIGNRMLLDGLKGNERLEVLVPVTIQKGTYSLFDLNDRHRAQETYNCEFKGHTAVRVGPPGGRPWYHIFRRDAMLADQAPMKKASPYVHPAKLIRWGVL
jgi:hypothetical protein